MDDVRCPKCAALVTAGAAWCSLCFQDLRPPAPEPEPEPLPEPPAEPAAGPLTAPDAAPPIVPDAAMAAVAAAAPRGRHARRDAEHVPVAGPAGVAGPAASGTLATLDAAAEAAADELLAALRVESGRSRAMGGLLGRLDSTGAKVGVMVGGVVLVTVVLFALMALVGSFL